jgi:hypothetical protein
MGPGMCNASLIEHKDGLSAKLSSKGLAILGFILQRV